jgi:hypothetical protein
MEIGHNDKVLSKPIEAMKAADLTESHFSGASKVYNSNKNNINIINGMNVLNNRENTRHSGLMFVRTHRRNTFVRNLTNTGNINPIIPVQHKYSYWETAFVGEVSLILKVQNVKFLV